LIPAWRIPGSVLFAEPASRFTVLPTATSPLPKRIPSLRLEQIYAKTCQVLADEKPDLMVLEDVFSLEKYPKSGIVLGKVCGVLLLAGTQSGVPLTEVPVRQAKQILTGNGKATKEQLERAVRRTLCAPSPIRPFHASDALGLALIGLFRHNPAI
jgi:crossover junction endodeoxyribonuclease RuvC